MANDDQPHEMYSDGQDPKKNTPGNHQPFPGGETSPNSGTAKSKLSASYVIWSAYKVCAGDL